MLRPNSYDSSISYNSVQSTLSSASASSTRVHAPSICTTDSFLSTEVQRPDTPDSYLTTGNSLPEHSDGFYVVALHDFTSDDPTHVSFQRNDIFEIVAVEPSGWWAAQIGDNVGWLPMGFVGIVQPGLLDRLLSAPHHVRAQLYEEGRSSYDEQLGSDPDIFDGPHPEFDPPALFEDQYDEVQVLTTPSDLRSPPIFPTDVTPFVTSRFEIPPHNSLPVPPRALPNPWPSRPHPYATVPQTPRTPRTPVPPRGPAPAPTIDTDVPPVPQPSTLGSNSTSPAPARRRAQAPVDGSPSTIRTASNPSMNESPVVPVTAGPNELDYAPRESTLYPRIRPGGGAARTGDKIRRITGEDEAQAFHNAKLAQAALPWYLKPEHIGDEIKLDHDGRVNAGTLEALVERLTVEPLRPEHEESYRHTFLTTFHSFTAADRVIELLIDRYEMDAPTDLVEEQFNEWKLQKLRPTQARVLHVFFVWVDQYGLMEDDPQVVRRLREFLELVNSPSPHAQIARKILTSIEQYVNINIRPFAPVMTPRRRASKVKNGYKNDFLRIDHNELARQLTLYEARLYLKIRPHECITWGSNQKGEGVRNLRPFVSTSDKLAAWVKMSVLNNDALGKRADTIDMWIKVAEKCRLFNNYSSMTAIIAALTSQVITKLQLTWAHVHRSSHIEPLMKLFEPTSNFNTYRNLFNDLGNASLPCLPYIGIYLSDMDKTYETYPNTIEVTTTEPDVPSREIRLVNFIKYRKMSDVVQTILRHQPKVREYKISETPNVMQFVETQLNLAASKDEGGFWMRSQEVQHAELAHADIRKGLEAAGF
ncbi:ras GEF [Hysterangium stoloniferum]|nr:ras GEF [Hysterangium stoloniferum]